MSAPGIEERFDVVKDVGARRSGRTRGGRLRFNSPKVDPEYLARECPERDDRTVERSVSGTLRNGGS